MKVLINGRAGCAVSVLDRGLQYGDGVFETMRVRGRQVRLLDYHLDRLYHGLKSLRIKAPPRRTVRAELERLASTRNEAVLKLMVTRGAGRRGYRPTGLERCTRVAMIHQLPRGAADRRPVRVRICATRLAPQPRLAGLKTLNRLESVLARSEWHDQRVWEGLMQDTEGRMVCGTMSNLFVRHGTRLITPPLEQCGVAGVMRRWILRNALQASLKVAERGIRWADLKTAEEVFLSNAVVGVRPVSAIEWRGSTPLRYVHFEAAAKLQILLESV